MRRGPRAGSSRNRRTAARSMAVLVRRAAGWGGGGALAPDSSPLDERGEDFCSGGDAVRGGGWVL